LLEEHHAPPLSVGGTDSDRTRASAGRGGDVAMRDAKRIAI